MKTKSFTTNFYFHEQAPMINISDMRFVLNSV